MTTPRDVPSEPKRGDVRYDRYGEFKCMAVADGYVMYRRPFSMPFVMTIREWQALSKHPVEKREM